MSAIPKRCPPAVDICAMIKFKDIVREEFHGAVYWYCPYCQDPFRGRAREYGRHIRICIHAPKQHDGDGGGNSMECQSDDSGPAAPDGLDHASDDSGPAAPDGLDHASDEDMGQLHLHGQHGVGEPGHEEDEPFDDASSQFSHDSADADDDFQGAAAGHEEDATWTAAIDAQLAALGLNPESCAAVRAIFANTGAAQGGSIDDDDSCSSDSCSSDSCSTSSHDSHDSKGEQDFQHPGDIPQFGDHGRWFRDHAAEPLYPATELPARVMVMQAIYFLADWKQHFRIPTTAFDVLVGFLGDKVWPEGNRLPRSNALFRRALKQANAAEYEWHVCGCERHAWSPLPLQQWQVHASDACPHCEGPRFVTHTTTGGRTQLEPVKVSDGIVCHSCRCCMS